MSDSQSSDMDRSVSLEEGEIADSHVDSLLVEQVRDGGSIHSRSVCPRRDYTDHPQLHDPPERTEDHVRNRQRAWQRETHGTD